MRELLHTCEALLKGGMIQCAKEAARGISAAAMLAASVAVEKSLAELTPPYLKQQANRGVDRKSALRKLTLYDIESPANDFIPTAGKRYSATKTSASTGPTTVSANRGSRPMCTGSKRREMEPAS